MAYFSQERKKELSPLIKQVLKKYNMKWTMSVCHLSKFILTIRSWEIDWLDKMKDEREFDTPYYSERLHREIDGVQSAYWKWWPHIFHDQSYHEFYIDEAKSLLDELYAIMYRWNHDNSDIMTDYFDVWRYVEICLKDYTLIKK